jgi:hypothetical protein
MIARWDRWFDTATPEERRGVGWVAIAMSIHAVLFALLSWWYVEDAAISFAFARNIAAGEGPVANLGGEYVEGYSNPTWTLALAALALIRIGPFAGAKLLGLIAGSGAIGYAWRVARRLLPGDAAAWVPLIVALCPQFVIWNASGLENSFFALFLACGLDWVLAETEPGASRAPWSALPLWALAITRPEAPMYTAAIAVVAFVGAVFRRGPRDALVWALWWNILFLPLFAGWHAARHYVFGWPFPNTYYAKLATAEKFLPFKWDKRGWDYLRKYAAVSGQGWLFPVYLASAVGLARWRRWLWVPAATITGVLLLAGFSPLRELFVEPELLVKARVWWLVAVAVAAPWLGVGQERTHIRAMLWYVTGLCVFFTVYSGGDWMKGYRWLSMPVIPISILLVDGAVALGDAIGPQVRRLSVGLALLPVASGLVGYFNFLGNPETMPYDVRRRVLHMQQAAERLGLEGRQTWMDVDMGAHLWWCDCDVVDMAGLVDVPMAHHTWQKPFVNQYVYEEREPAFAHVHGSWSTRTRMTTHRAWKSYLEIDPFPVSPSTNHVGSHVWKNLFVEEGDLGETEVISFERAISMRRPTFAARVSPGGTLHVEVEQQSPAKSRFRTLVFLHGARDVVAELPPGYDWYPSSGWGPHEVVVGRHEVSLPADLPVGRYDFGIVLVEESGSVLAAQTVGATDGLTDTPVYMAGEVRWAGAVEVVSDGGRRLAAAEQVARAAAAATTDGCGLADWQVARQVLGRGDVARVAAETRLATDFARCFARDAAAVSSRAGLTRAEVSANADAAERKIAIARRFDHRDPEVVRIGRGLAEKWSSEAEVAVSDADAYRSMRRALRADPTRSDLRVRAETLRDRSLNLVKDEPSDPSAGEAAGD